MTDSVGQSYSLNPIPNITLNNNINITNITLNNQNDLDDTHEISRPKFINVDAEDSYESYTPVIDVVSTDFLPDPTIFWITGKNIYGREKALEPTPENLTLGYQLPSIVLHLVLSSNAYREVGEKSKPNL